MSLPSGLPSAPRRAPRNPLPLSRIYALLPGGRMSARFFFGHGRHSSIEVRFWLIRSAPRRILRCMNNAAANDQRVLERARISRDPRFDGRFYVGVLTTGIYCRPICPANAPKSENVRFFPTAAAAGEAGFRPCLRCRPECAPGTPAWAGTSTTVRRGLRLIADGVLFTHQERP